MFPHKLFRTAFVSPSSLHEFKQSHDFMKHPLLESLTAVSALCTHNFLSPMTLLRYIVLRPFPLSSEISP